MARAAGKATALWVLRRLRTHGYTALLAGGCVRDMLLGRPSKDYDVATNATPDVVKSLFGHVLLIGAKFGVAMVIVRGQKVEVTTFRCDLSYSDGRRPDGVKFSTPQEDAERRDFTINGMFYDPVANEVIDYVGGQKDLARGVIKTIGQPALRFSEDYLRLLRAVRFATTLGFHIDKETVHAATELAGRISAISGERIYDELIKMLCVPTAGEALRTMHRLKLAQAILPELFDQADWATAVQRVEAVARRQDVGLVLAALLADLRPAVITRIVRRWGASNALSDALTWIAEHLNDWTQGSSMPLADLKRLMTNANFERLRRLWAFHERRQTHRVVISRQISRRIKGIDPAKIAPKPFVTGRDLHRIGQPEGVRLGEILRQLYDEQLNETLSNRREALSRARHLVAGK